ncbi:MAG: hypothetical protein HQ582_04845 [Planctomycetes bacterium]|nr:hypothetical protein [Planctomycetota bacterium]
MVLENLGYRTQMITPLDNKSTYPLLFALLLVAAAVSGQTDQVHGETASGFGNQTFFSFDDRSIPWRHNVKLTLVEAKKHPANPVLRCGPKGAPDHGHAILYGSVFRTGEKFRMWYLGMFETELARGQAPGWWRPMCYAESDDGVTWTKPELGLVEFNGDKRNNICLIESDPVSLSRVNDFLTVIHEPDDPDPAQRYKAAFIAHVPFDEVRGGRSGIGPDESRWGSMVCATSADGLRWKVVGDRPMNSGGERFEVSGLYRFGDFYYATGQLLSPWTALVDGREVGRVMLVSRSSDFETWSRVPALAFARPGQWLPRPIPGQQTHMGAGMWNRGNVLVGLYGMWQDGPTNKPGGTSHLWGTHIDLGLITSNDGIHFREPIPDFKVISRGRTGQWDDVALLQGHAFVNVGDQTMIWYSHWDTGGKLKSMEIGLATLRRDGFGYLSRRVKGAAGHFVSRLVEPGAGPARLFVNVEGAVDESPLLVELLDGRDRPIRDYSGRNGARVASDGTRREIVWPALKSGRLDWDEPFSIKVTLPAKGDVRVYAVYVE